MDQSSGVQTCPRCSGGGVTEKQQHTVEIDENGTQVPRVYSFTGQCDHCGGKGWVG